MACLVQLRGDTAANWESVNPILAIRQMGIDLTNANFKIGDGITAWNSLPFYITALYTNEMAQDAVGGILTDTTSIDFTYNDGSNQISAVVLPGGVDHDSLLNMSANKHIDHTLVSITGTDGLSGGGDITASRTITMPDVGTADAYGNSSSTLTITTDAKGRVSSVEVSDISISSSAILDFSTAVSDILGLSFIDSASIDITYDAMTQTLSGEVLPAGVDHDSLANYSVNCHIDHSTVSIIPGTGLTGGGNLTEEMTLSLADTDVTAGTYNASATQTQSFTVDAQGRLTATGDLVTITPAWSSITSKPTTLSGYGITDAVNSAGDTMTGNLVMTANTLITLPTPTGGFTNDSDAVNKSYVDSLVAGFSWRDPVMGANLLGVLSTPPSTPSYRNTYLVGPNPTDAWVGLAGKAVQWNDTSWVEFEEIEAGYRFGISFTVSESAVSPFTGKDGQIVTIESADGSGNYTFSYYEPLVHDTVTNMNPEAIGFGRSFSYTHDSTWVESGGNASIDLGDGLYWAANTLNIGLGSGITKLPLNNVGLDLYTTGGLFLTENGTDASSNSSAKLSLTKIGTAGTYKSVTVDDHGRVSSGSNPTTLSGYGITDAQSLDADLTAIAAISETSGLLKKTAENTWTLDTSVYLTANESISLSGDITGTGTTSISTALSNTGVVAATYGSATQTGQFTVDAKGRITSASNITISIPSTAITDFAEAVQDVLGAILTDTNTIDFSYTDSTDVLLVEVKTQMSITSDISGLKLVGDVASPGNTLIYGTNSSGEKGWYPIQLPEGGQPYHGFPTPYEVTMSYNAATRQVTITPIGASFIVWINGIKFIKTGAQVSPAHPNTTGSHFIFYDNTGTLQISDTVWQIDSYLAIPVCYVFYNTAVSDGIALFEAHSSHRNPQTHAILHSLNGAFIHSTNDFTLADFTLSVASDAAVTFSTSYGRICDEDIEWDVAAVPDGGPYFIMYKSVSDWQWFSGNTIPYLFNRGNLNNTIQYNQNNGGNWQLTDVPDNSYVNYYMLAATSLETNKRLVLIPSSQVYGSLSAARSEMIYSIDFNTFPVKEMSPLYKFTYLYKSTNGNSGRASLEAVSRYNLTFADLQKAQFYRRDEHLDIADPYTINFGSTQRESLILNYTIGGDTDWNYVVLLAHLDGFNGSTIFTDSSRYAHTLVRFGTPTISTVQSKFGGASLSCDGTGDYLRSLAYPEMIIPTNGDYTIEAWVYSTVSGAKDIFTWGPAPYWNVWKNSSNFLVFYGNGADRITGATAIANNTWYHVAISRSSGTYRLFLNGVSQGGWANTTGVGEAEFWIGGWPSGGAEWAGYIDEVRFTNGVSRYTSNFTPSTAPFAGGNQHYAMGSQNNTFYSRSSSEFAWYINGVYSPAQGDPGLGGLKVLQINEAGKVFVPYELRIGIDQGIDIPSVLIESVKTINSSLQNNIQNLSNGETASSEWVATKDTGNNSSGFVSIGINSSGYNEAAFNSGGPGDAYVLVNGGALALITQDNFEIGFFTNGATSNQRRLTIYPTSDVVMGLGALTSNATAGFLYNTSCPGQPTGTPTTYSGRVPFIFDTNNNDMYYYTNGNWRTDTSPWDNGGWVSANFYDNAATGAAPVTRASASNQLTVMPFTVRRDLTINQIGIAISANGGGGSNANVVIYASNPDTGWPAARLAITGNLSTTGTGYVSAAISFTFRKGVRYWLGVHTSANPTLRAIPVAGMQSLGLSSNNGTTYFTVLQQTVAFGSSPNPWVFASTQLVSSIGYSIRFRAA